MKISVEEITQILKKKVNLVNITTDHSHYTYFHIRPEDVILVSQILKEDPALSDNSIILTQMFGTDFPDVSEIELIYSFWDITSEIFFHFKTRISYQDLSIKSIADNWEAAIWHEREAYEMFGVTFKGNPNLDLPFLLNEEMVGVHPMLKSFNLEARDREINK